MLAPNCNASWLASNPQQQAEFLASLSDEEALALLYEWKFWARQEQLEPPAAQGGGDWLVWLLLAGRGFGKTRTGAETIRDWAESGLCKRIALIAPTAGDVRDVMIEGESGLLAISAPWFRPAYEPSNRRITWPNGAIATTYSADEPERLRGPQHDGAWCFIAGTMIATGAAERKVEDLVAGDAVLTRFGLKRIRHASARMMPIGEVIFSHGRKLVGTADHPVLTSHGWTRMSDLRDGATVCVANASSGAESAGTDIAAGISSSVERAASGTLIETDSTGPYGATCTAKYPPATTSTMTTRISPTTRTAILFACLMASTKAFTFCLTQSSLWTGAKRKFFQRPARIAAILSIGSSAAQRHQSASHASSSGPIRSERPPGNAASAALNSSVFAETSAASVVSTWAPVGQAKVFNLQVEDAPEYFANGVLVHNCDELASWRYPEAWDQLQFGLRLGSNPRVVVTTTPKPIPIIKDLLKDPTTAVTRGSTYDNRANLAASFFTKIVTKYEGTRLGRQELKAEVLDDVPGALWTRAMLDKAQARPSFVPPDFVRVVVAVDPSGTKGNGQGDDIGIVAAAKGSDGRAYVLADRTASLSPAGWGRRVVETYDDFSADRVVAEVNYGGAMVEATIIGSAKDMDHPFLPYSPVHASRGKAVRAGPVAALYEQGRVTHLAGMPQLEDECCNFTSDGYVGGRSPNRADALVWALTELMLDKTAPREPKVW